MKGKYTKKLQKTDLYKELQANKISYYEHSLAKEQKLKNFLSKMTLKNPSTNEIFKIDHNFEKKHNSYAQIINQKISTIEQIAKRKGYTSVFITLTLPTQFHPFISKRYKNDRIYTHVNPNFEFDSLAEATSQGYQYLNHIYQTFYKRVKNYLKNDLSYVKCIEPHSSMIPHMHIVLYFPYEKTDYVKGVYKRVTEDFELTQVDYQTSQFKDDISHCSRYLLKYITKDLKNGADYFLSRSYEGWKLTHKIRQITSSIIPLNMDIYKKLYYSITNVNHTLKSKNKINSKNKVKLMLAKEEIYKKVITNGIPLYLFFQDNLFIEKRMSCIDHDFSIKHKKSKFGSKKALFKVYIDVIRDYNNNDKLRYTIENLTIKYRGIVIYKKQKFIKI